MTLNNLAILTSGGDSPGMNAAIRAVVRTGVFYKKRVFGVQRGYDGLIQNDFRALDARSVKGILSRGGTILKSARSEAFRTKKGREAAAYNLNKNNINALIVIGGDGTFTGAHLLHKEFGFPIIGIPGTIDNDLYGTDNTIGYDTANNTVVKCIDKIRDTANSHNRLFIVEVMGRDSGFIALSAGVATGALDVVLPETATNFDRMFDAVQRGVKNKKTSNIIVTVLGHVQRGGSPSTLDRVNASVMGVAAVENLINGKSDVMVGIVNNKVKCTSLERSINNNASINFELERISKILST
jgi:6-phosphofructokinase 1